MGGNQDIYLLISKLFDVESLLISKLIFSEIK